MTNINYYTVHRSGCSLKRDSLIDPDRLYIDHNKYGIEQINLLCDFKGLFFSIWAPFEILTVNDEFDYSSFNSLN